MVSDGFDDGYVLLFDKNILQENQMIVWYRLWMFREHHRQRQFGYRRNAEFRANLRRSIGAKTASLALRRCSRPLARS
jgi:hypothetical protein